MSYIKKIRLFTCILVLACYSCTTKKQTDFATIFSNEICQCLDDSLNADRVSKNTIKNCSEVVYKRYKNELNHEGINVVDNDVKFNHVKDKTENHLATSCYSFDNIRLVNKGNFIPDKVSGQDITDSIFSGYFISRKKKDSIHEIITIKNESNIIKSFLNIRNERIQLVPDIDLGKVGLLSIYYRDTIFKGERIAMITFLAYQ